MKISAITDNKRSGKIYNLPPTKTASSFFKKNHVDTVSFGNNLRDRRCDELLNQFKTLDDFTKDNLTTTNRLGETPVFRFNPPTIKLLFETFQDDNDFLKKLFMTSDKKGMLPIHKYSLNQLEQVIHGFRNDASFLKLMFTTPDKRGNILAHHAGSDMINGIKVMKTIIAVYGDDKDGLVQMLNTTKYQKAPLWRRALGIPFDKEPAWKAFSQIFWFSTLDARARIFLEPSSPIRIYHYILEYLNTNRSLDFSQDEAMLKKVRQLVTDLKHLEPYQALELALGFERFDKSKVLEKAVIRLSKMLP